MTDGSKKPMSNSVKYYGQQWVSENSENQVSHVNKVSQMSENSEDQVSQICEISDIFENSKIQVAQVT